jgi:hypothetical protein
MDAAEFDRLIARARNPRLIPGIYNYCDGRCPRCRFTDRCLVYLADPEQKELSANNGVDRSCEDPLTVRAQEYGDLAWRIARALAPAVEARGDALVIEAVQTIDWFSSLIGAKIDRAVKGAGGRLEPADDSQSDYSGSAKVALIGIAESRCAWAVLMIPGKATANGVPAQAVKMLDALEAAVSARFPHAMAFTRPGFDDS